MGGNLGPLLSALCPRPSASEVTVQMTEGKRPFTDGGKKRELTAGDVVYIAPNSRHTLVMVDTAANA